MSRELKKELAAYINKKVNLPLLNEQQEQALIELVLDLVIGLIPGILARGLVRID